MTIYDPAIYVFTRTDETGNDLHLQCSIRYDIGNERSRGEAIVRANSDIRYCSDPGKLLIIDGRILACETETFIKDG
jgi:hypothetical protein